MRIWFSNCPKTRLTVENDHLHICSLWVSTLTFIDKRSQMQSEQPTVKDKNWATSTLQTERITGRKKMKNQSSEPWVQKLWIAPLGPLGCRALSRLPLPLPGFTVNAPSTRWPAAAPPAFDEEDDEACGSPDPSSPPPLLPTRLFASDDDDAATWPCCRCAALCLFGLGGIVPPGESGSSLGDTTPLVRRLQRGSREKGWETKSKWNCKWSHELAKGSPAIEVNNRPRPKKNRPTRQLLLASLEHPKTLAMAIWRRANWEGGKKTNKIVPWYKFYNNRLPCLISASVDVNGSCQSNADLIQV